MKRVQRKGKRQACLTKAIMITNAQIEKFRHLYKKHMGREITKAEALEKLPKLVDIVKKVYEPLFKKDK